MKGTRMNGEREIGASGLPLIGPHVRRELELMLKGIKPMAAFSVEPGMDPKDCGEEFEPYVEQGLFVKFTAPGSPPVVERRWYCLKGQEWRGKLACFIDQQHEAGTLPHDFYGEDWHRMDGYLLGYPEECINHFIEKTKRK